MATPHVAEPSLLHRAISAFDERMRPRPKDAPPPPLTYDSAGGGEFRTTPTPIGAVASFFGFFVEEMRRPPLNKQTGTMVIGPDRHSRPPAWVSEKNVTVTGRPIADEVRAADPTYWQTKYKSELSIGEAVAAVRAQRRYEKQHDMVGFVAKVRRLWGSQPPLDEAYAIKNLAHQKYLEEAPAHIQDTAPSLKETASSSPVAEGVTDIATGSAGTGKSHESSPDGTLRSGPDRRSLQTAWKVLLESATTSTPIAKVAQVYRPRIEYYSLDPFLDSTPSVVWLSVKVGGCIGFLQGTATACQAINVDVEFLRASGVGVLSILNVTVFANVVKWGGNMGLFALAFCAGDRLATRAKRCILPAHDARHRSMVNYVAGFSAAGAAVGVLPWWVLGDTALASRLCVSGAGLGALMGVGVGYCMQRLLGINLSRLDATPRQLRRYEAVMLRERAWREQDRERFRSRHVVWW